MDTAHKKKQKPLSLIILICVVLFIVMIIGIILAQSTAQQTLPKSTQKPSCNYANAVCTYLANFTPTNPFYAGPITATITLTQAKNEKGEVMLQSDSQNNIYALLSQNGKKQGEILIIDNKLYKKDTQGNWQQQQNLGNDTITQFRVKAFQQVNKSGKDVTYTYIDTQPCGTSLCMQYRITTPKLGKTKEFIFFDTKEYILRKIVQETPDGTNTQTILTYTPLAITSPPIK